jgi:microcystin-dependent protein
MDYYVGEIRMFCGLFIPLDWYYCDGSELPLNSYTNALFSVIGNTYGGTPGRTFKLPDMRTKVPIGAGTGGGLATYTLGQSGGSANYQLPNVLPHTHTLSGTSAAVKTNDPNAKLLADLGARVPKYSTGKSPNGTLNAGSVANTGSGVPVSNLQPYLPVNYMICVVGAGG